MPVGRLLVGALLVLLGVGWLLDALGVAELDWELILPIALIAVGGALVLAAWQGRGQGGLIALGVVLTVVLTIGTVMRIPFGGGIGDQTQRPLTAEALPDRYELAIGKLTVDLTDLGWEGETPGEVRVEAAVGIGQLVVIVGSDFPCTSIHAQAGLGEVVVFGDRQGGVSPEFRTEAVCLAAPLLVLDASVGLGQVEVRRG
jgi:hypothetical protein